jgi:phosphatidylglycerophosphate synthase
MGATITAERRPIAARNWRLSRRLARFLAEGRVSPNAISIAGLACGLAAGLSLAATSIVPNPGPVFWLLGAVLILLRLLANMLDGMVAVESGKASRLGELFNEVPDRISDAAVLVGLGYASGGNVTLGYLAALAAMFTTYVRAVGKTAGAPQEFCGPMAKQQRMAVVIGTAFVCAMLPNDWLATAALGLTVGGCAITAARRLMRIAVNLRRVAP